jgi:hypothetical protein
VPWRNGSRTPLLERGGWGRMWQGVVASELTSKIPRAAVPVRLHGTWTRDDDGGCSPARGWGIRRSLILEIRDGAGRGGQSEKLIVIRAAVRVHFAFGEMHPF